MSTLSDLVHIHGTASSSDTSWLHRLVGDWQLLADLAFADMVLWIPTREGSFAAVAHARPSSAATLFYRDFVGQIVKPEWNAQIADAFERKTIVDSSAPDWFEEIPTRVKAVPVVRQTVYGEARDPIAVLTAHTNLRELRRPSRQELTFNECARDLFGMIAAGDFPDPAAHDGPRRGVLRATDGLLRLDADGGTTFASPNALSAFNRMGFSGELEGQILSDVTERLLADSFVSNELLRSVVTGRAPWRTDMESRGVTVALRSIPIRHERKNVGAIVLCRDVTEQRHHERELITKDATIREIHHRVKNNLQTVASLLRIQARRSDSDEVREALAQAMRRVGAIAVVHDTLSEGLSQSVDFDVVFNRVLLLISEAAATHNTKVNAQLLGKFGVLPSEYATPLALALTELVTNAVEHGLAGERGKVEIVADRTGQRLEVIVRDNGAGFAEGKIGSGLGTQIVRTLIQGELRGAIDWHTELGQGTNVTIDVPLPAMSASREPDVEP